MRIQKYGLLKCSFKSLAVRAMIAAHRPWGVFCCKNDTVKQKQFFIPERFRKEFVPSRETADLIRSLIYLTRAMKWHGNCVYIYQTETGGDNYD